MLLLVPLAMAVLPSVGCSARAAAARGEVLQVAAVGRRDVELQPQVGQLCARLRCWVLKFTEMHSFVFRCLLLTSFVVP